MRENAVYRYLARFGQAVSETGPLIFEWPGYRYFALTRSGAPGGRALPNPRGGIDDSGITTLGASGGVGHSPVRLLEELPSTTRQAQGVK
jgi:hypothetical protein